MYRILKITHEEIELIKASSQQMYEDILDIVSKNRNILNKETINSLINQANRYSNIQIIFDGERDQ